MFLMINLPQKQLSFFYFQMWSADAAKTVASLRV